MTRHVQKDWRQPLLYGLQCCLHTIRRRGHATSMMIRLDPKQMHVAPPVLLELRPAVHQYYTQHPWGGWVPNFTESCFQQLDAIKLRHAGEGELGAAGPNQPLPPDSRQPDTTPLRKCAWLRRSLDENPLALQCRQQSNPEEKE